MKRLILPLALVAALSASALPSRAANAGATLTYGRITVNLCVDGCGGKTTFAMIGTYVISGKVYVGQIIGIADTTWSEDHTTRFVAPFSLTGVSPLQQVIQLDCDGITFGPESGFRISCSGAVTGGGFGFRTIVVKGKATDVACGCDKRRIQGSYRGVA